MTLLEATCQRCLDLGYLMPDREPCTCSPARAAWERVRDQARAQRVRAGARRNSGWGGDNRVPVDALAAAVARSQDAPAEIAMRADLLRNGYGDGRQLLRAVGLRARSDGSVASTLDYDFALKLANALLLDPVEVGL